MIRPMTVSDVSEIVAIYAHYVNNTVVTFDTEVPSETEIIRPEYMTKKESMPFTVMHTNGKLKKPSAPPLRQPSTSIRTIPAKDTDVY